MWLQQHYWIIRDSQTMGEYGRFPTEELATQRAAYLNCGHVMQNGSFAIVENMNIMSDEHGNTILVGDSSENVG